MLQPDKLDCVVPHLNGKLLRGFPRRVIVHQAIGELREKKIPLFNSWSIRFDVPMDMAIDCDEAMKWITNRLLDFKDAGFKCIEISAEIREVKRNRESKDEPTWEPFWSGMFVHPEGKDPRKVVQKCIHYSQPTL